MKKIRLIIAGSHLEFDRYCDNHKLTPKESKYMTCMEDLMGNENCFLVLAGTYWNNSLFKRFGVVVDYCKCHNIKIPEKLRDRI